jgi:hypothetical protein
MQLTVGTDAKGNLDKSDVMMFMKNIGGVKEKWINSCFFTHRAVTEIDPHSRVNAVETLYAAFPALMYIDPGLGGLLLEPLFRLQTSRNSGASSQAAADLGECRIITNIEIWYLDRCRIKLSQCVREQFKF